jgi:lysophospholipase L1-like esterase
VTAGLRRRVTGVAGVAGVVALMLALASAVAAGCSPGGGAESPSAASAEDHETYVAVGADDTLGVGLDRPLVDEWPKVLFRDELPRGTVFVNAAAERASVADALDHQVPLALELDPTLVTVWLNLDDLALGTPVATYERGLTDVVHALRQGGQTRVLVANTPEFPGAAPARVAAYNAAIARVARAEGAELVDLHAADVAAPSRSHPSPEGHAAIAKAFAAVL